jgi:murein tripeptide amidase MpaA
MLSSLFLAVALSPILSASTVASASNEPAQNEPPRAPLLDHRQLQVAMNRLATEHSDLVTILSVGTSRQDRKIDALRLSAGERKPGRPAILIVANIDGPWVYTSGIALDHAQRLAEGYTSDSKIKTLLDSTTIYIVPRVDPDAAEFRFLKPKIEQRASGHGVDNDRDGRNGEDPPSDVNDDGQVTMLRVADPEGEWTTDPADARAMIKADHKKGQRGGWKLMSEGRDLDHDKSTGEDGELDAEVNRNFPQGWRMHEPESGQYATDEPETRALCDFLLLHKDIALVLVYGRQDNLVDKPKSVADSAPRVKLLPPDGTLESDADLYVEIGKRYKRITQNATKGDGDDHGSFQAWCEKQRGLWTLDCALWSIPLDDAKKDEKKSDAASGKDDGAPGSSANAQKNGSESAPPPKSAGAGDKSAETSSASKPADKKDEDKPAPSDDAKRLRWIDASGETWRFVPWKPFQHPELGAVEIGGFAPFGTIEPPDADRVKIAQSQFEFVVTLGDLLPRVRVASATSKELSNGLWEVKAAIVNEGFLPVLSAAARRASSVRPVRVTMRVPSGAQFLAGARQELVPDLSGSGGRKEFRWLVKGATPSQISVEVDSDHAGSLQVTPEVK